MGDATGSEGDTYQENDKHAVYVKPCIQSAFRRESLASYQPDTRSQFVTCRGRVCCFTCVLLYLLMCLYPIHTESIVFLQCGRRSFSLLVAWTCHQLCEWQWSVFLTRSFLGPRDCWFCFHRKSTSDSAACHTVVLHFHTMTFPMDFFREERYVGRIAFHGLPVRVA